MNALMFQCEACGKSHLLLLAVSTVLTPFSAAQTG